MKYRFEYLLALWLVFALFNPLAYSLREKSAITGATMACMTVAHLTFYICAKTATPTGNGSPYGYCSVCQAARAQRAHHCTRCYRCVDNFDHHCSIMCMCVTLDNMLALIGFLIVFIAQATTSLLFGLLNLRFKVYLLVIMSLPISLFVAVLIIPIAVQLMWKYCIGLTEVELKRFTEAQSYFNRCIVARTRIKVQARRSFRDILLLALLIVRKRDHSLSWLSLSSSEQDVFRYVFC